MIAQRFNPIAFGLRYLCVPVSPLWEPPAGTFSRDVTPFVDLNFEEIQPDRLTSLARVADDGFRSWSWSVGASPPCSLRLSLVVPRGRSCPCSASPVATGHPEELHQQEQFRVLAYRAVYFVLFVRVSKPPYIRPLINLNVQSST